MGFDFCDKWVKKTDVIEEVTANCAEYVVVGREVWGICHDRSGLPYIALHLLDKDKSRWGYKYMTEQEYPFYFSCPLRFLAKVLPVNLEWRKAVHEWHASKAKRKDILANLEVGSRVRLSGSKPSEFIVTSLKPLHGESGGKEYKLIKERIVEVLP
jgi:hypothetical protein